MICDLAHAVTYNKMPPAVHPARLRPQTIVRRQMLWAAAAMIAACLTLHAAPNWLLLNSGNLTVLGDQPAGRIRSYALELEQFRNAVALVLPSARQLSRPTTLYLFNDEKALQPFLRIVNGKTVSSAGMFIRRADQDYMFANVENIDQATPILFHEYTHMLLSAGSASIPPWLNEGLAEYFSTFTLTSGNRRATLGIAPARHPQTLSGKTLVPVSRILEVDHQSPLYNEDDRRSIFYAESWALVHYIIAEVKGGTAAINTFITMLMQDTPPDRAFPAAFGLTTTEIDRKLQEYVGQFAYKAIVFTFPEALKLEAAVPRSITMPEVEARLGELQLQMRPPAEAGARIEAAAKGATIAYPYVVLGQLRLAQQRVAEGLAALQRAVTLDQNSFSAQYAYGNALVRYAPEAEASGIATARREAVATLTKATALNPQVSDAHESLAYLYLSERQLPEARAAIERAITLAPGRLDYRLRAADVLLSEGKLEDAKKLLTNIVAADPRGPMASAAETRLQRVAERERRNAALAGGAAEVGDAGSSLAPTPAPRTAAPPSTSTTYVSGPPRVRYDFRKVGAGESQAFGELINVECADGVIRLHLKTANAQLVATARQFQDFDIVTFRDELNGGMFNCGVRPPNDRVYLTWRTPAAGTETPGVAGEAVAVEFMPADYTTPQQLR